MHRELAVPPRPRKHYQWYYASREASDEMLHCAEGLHAFLRAYYHHKSADWPGNQPPPLKAWAASELAKLPTYYVMDLHETMAQTVGHEMPSAEQIATCKWLPDSELEVYAREYQRTGFQGGLQWYRCAIDRGFSAELALFSGRTIDVPSLFISGASDWGHYQRPGALEAMQTAACRRLLGCHFVEGAGHWVQQEQPELVISLLMEFLRSSASL